MRLARLFVAEIALAIVMPLAIAYALREPPPPTKPSRGAIALQSTVYSQVVPVRWCQAAEECRR